MNGNPEEKYLYVVKFSKNGKLIYISHLDLMTLLRRAVRRAAIPFILTKGFSPRVKLSLMRALKLGVPSDAEEMKLWLSKRMDPGEVKDRLNQVLPEDVKVSEVLIK
jgi:radical SAM-linked protein